LQGAYYTNKVPVPAVQILIYCAFIMFRNNSSKKIESGNRALDKCNIYFIVLPLKYRRLSASANYHNVFLAGEVNFLTDDYDTIVYLIFMLRLCSVRDYTYGIATVALRVGGNYSRTVLLSETASTLPRELGTIVVIYEVISLDLPEKTNILADAFFRIYGSGNPFSFYRVDL